MANQPNQKSNSETLEEIVEHFTGRLRAGEHPAIADYQSQHPTLKDEIEDLLASVAMIEQLKSTPASQSSNRDSLASVSNLKQIGEYEVIGEIGRGGMGVVFEAVHQTLGRRVAIKVMPTPLVNREKYVERFKRESQAAARLHHTNIVGVFGMGDADGYHYYVMDFVDGQTLSEIVFGLAHASSASKPTFIDDETQIDDLPETNEDVVGTTAKQKLPKPSLPDSIRSDAPALNAQHFRWSARIGANIADALDYAHDKNILHRDIKPSNIIVDRKGVVWITDFGLAKDSANEINLTKTGDVIGTPQYLAPESLQGMYDHRTEVYCLGLTLYELATLQPAYKNGTTAEVIAAIASTSPISPRKLNPRIPIDLSTIIDKALERDPTARYQSAKEMQRDLSAFVEDRPIAARPPSTFENVVKWGRRNPLPAMLSAVSALLLVLVAASATTGYLYTIDALGKEADKSAKLEAQQRETERQRLVAVEERKKMQVEFDRAEGNIAITLKAFDEMFKQVVSRGASVRQDISLDGFEELTGIETSITQEDAAFLEKLLVFYDEFAKQNADNDSLRIESARAFRRVANIYQLIGNPRKAIDAYENAIDGYEKVLKQSPDSRKILIALVNTKSELSRIHRRSQAWREAIDENKSAIELLDQVPVEQLDNELKFEMAKTLNSLGSSSALFNAFEQARPDWFQQQMGMLTGRRPPPPDRRRPGDEGPPRDNRPTGNDGTRPADRGSAGRGSRHRPGMGNPTRFVEKISRHYTRRAIEILDGLLADEPGNQEYRFVRASCYCSLAAVNMQKDQKFAIQNRDLAIKELEALVNDDPENHEYQYRLALACSLADQRDNSASETNLLKKSVRITETLAENFPQFLDYHYLLVSVYSNYARRLIEATEFPEALESLQAAVDAHEKASGLSRFDRTQRSSALVVGKHINKLSRESEKAGQTNVSKQAKILLDSLRKRNPVGRSVR